MYYKLNSFNIAKRVVIYEGTSKSMVIENFSVDNDIWVLCNECNKHRWDISGGTST